MEQVSLRDVRSYPRLDLSLEPGLVLITGPNGAGKTNLLEAVHVATQGVSFRTRQDAQIVRRGTEEGVARVSGTRGDVRLDAEVHLSTREPKRIRLNGAAVPSAGAVAGACANTLAVTASSAVARVRLSAMFDSVRV